jgi:hypothetical protein
VPAWQGTDEIEDLPSRGQHVGHAVGFSEMLLDQLDLFHANPLPPLNWRSMLCRYRKSPDAFHSS